MPLCLGTSRLVRASRMPCSALCPLVVQVFCPLTTKSSPSSTAVVWSEARSEPAFGSLSSEHQRTSPRAMGGRKVFFCHSVP